MKLTKNRSNVRFFTDRRVLYDTSTLVVLLGKNVLFINNDGTPTATADYCRPKKPSDCHLFLTFFCKVIETDLRLIWSCFVYLGDGFVHG